MNESAVLKENEDLVQFLFREMSNCASLKDDLLQEGRIALVKAARAWQSDREAQFRTFASTLVRNAMIDFLRAQKPLCSSMDEVLENSEGSYTRHDILGAPATQENDLIACEQTARLLGAVAKLSPTQRAVVSSRLYGVSGEDTAVERGTNNRAVNNAYTRALPTLRKLLNSDQ